MKTVIIRLNEELYAADSGAAYARAEEGAAQTNNYPVVYPEPFNIVGCGYGSLNAFVLKQCSEVGSELGIEVDVCNQIEIILELYDPKGDGSNRFVDALNARLAHLHTWIKQPIG